MLLLLLSLVLFVKWVDLNRLVVNYDVDVWVQSWLLWRLEWIWLVLSVISNQHVTIPSVVVLMLLLVLRTHAKEARLVIIMLVSVFIDTLLLEIIVVVRIVVLILVVRIFFALCIVHNSALGLFDHFLASAFGIPKPLLHFLFLLHESLWLHKQLVSGPVLAGSHLLRLLNCLLLVIVCLLVVSLDGLALDFEVLAQSFDTLDKTLPFSALRPTHTAASPWRSRHWLLCWRGTTPATCTPCRLDRVSDGFVWKNLEWSVTNLISLVVDREHGRCSIDGALGLVDLNPFLELKSYIVKLRPIG